MYNIKTINKISPVGLDKLKAKGCNVGEDIAAPDGIIVRSADMHDYEVNPELLGVARAGAGYNNIPIDELAEKGIVVFNSPGANAEAVKEQTVCSMVLASRDVVGSIEWVKSIADQGDKIPTLVEKAFSAWEQLARWSQMPALHWIWMLSAMTRLCRSRLHGDFRVTQSAPTISARYSETAII